MPRKPEEIRAELARNGLSLAAWARSNGFSEALTYRVMRGQPAKLGQSHRIAIALGLKEGGTSEAHDLNFAATSFLDVAKLSVLQSVAAYALLRLIIDPPKLRIELD